MAVFSNREKTRRHSLSQTIERSTIFGVDNNPRRIVPFVASRSSFDFDGMIGFDSKIDERLVDPFGSVAPGAAEHSGKERSRTRRY